MPPMNPLKYVAAELGFSSFLSSTSPVSVFILFLSRSLRLFSFGLIAPILILHLRLIDVPDRIIGLFLTLTLLGDVVISLIVTWLADGVGRRFMVAVGAAGMVLAGTVFATETKLVPLLVAAVLGVVSPSGNEVGPFSSLELGMLSQLVPPEDRVNVMMWYQFNGYIFTSVGSLTSGLIVSSLENSGWELLRCYQLLYAIYAATGLLKIVLSFLMSRTVEVDGEEAKSKNSQPEVRGESHAADGRTPDERSPLLGNGSTASSNQEAPSTTVEVPPAAPAPTAPGFPWKIVLPLSILFSLDAFAGALVPSSFISYYLRLTYSAPLVTISSTLSTGSILSGISVLAAGSIAKRIGLVNTMVFTHMPSQFLTAAFAFMPTIQTAIIVLLLRYSISQMDVAPRTAFLAGIVPKHNRTRVMGVVNVVKTLGSSLGPTVSGLLASRGQLKWSFVICGAMKLIYDFGILAWFGSVKIEH